MKLDDSDLCKRSKQLELQRSQIHRFSHGCISALELLLLDAYDVLRPRKVDYEHRIHLIHLMNSLVKKIYGYHSGFPKVEALGSFVMDIFTPKSDLDLSVNFNADETSSFPRKKKVSILRKLAQIFYAQEWKGDVIGVLPVLKARVPVLKLVDCGTGVECDISIENKDGISRSLMVKFMCQVDHRLQILCFLVKVWAKAQMINSPKDRTLSSLSITLLVTLHFQTRDPPILPPFSALLRDGQELERVRTVVNNFKQYGRVNRESLSELFISFLIKMSSVRSLWELGLCASTFEGSWISKQLINGSIDVEDFLDRSQNCARAVGKSEFVLIYDHIDRSLDQLKRFKNGYINGPDLELLLFGPVSLHIRYPGGGFNELGHQKRSLTGIDSTFDQVSSPLRKKMRYAEPLRGHNRPNSEATVSNPDFSVPPMSSHHTAYQSCPRVLVGPSGQYLSARPVHAPWPVAPSPSYWHESYPPVLPRDRRCI